MKTWKKVGILEKSGPVVGRDDVDAVPMILFAVISAHKVIPDASMTKNEIVGLCTIGNLRLLYSWL